MCGVCPLVASSAQATRRRRYRAGHNRAGAGCRRRPRPSAIWAPRRGPARAV